MMKKVGKITRIYTALKIELDARPGATFVIGAAGAARLINDGETARIYQVTRTADVDLIEDVGAAYPTRSGRGIAVNIVCGAPVLPDLYASRAQVEAVCGGVRSAALVSAPEDLGIIPPRKEETRVTDRGLTRGFGDDGNPPRRMPTHFRVVAPPKPAIRLKEE